MKLKNFKDLIEECLTKEEIVEIEQQAELELQAMQSLQNCLKKAMEDYMKKLSTRQ